jgi:hypothetical protein
MAIYAPIDLLVGTIEEDTGFIGATEFSIRNSDGKPLYSVEYKHGVCPIGSLCCCAFTCGSPHFKVKSCDTKTEIGKILEKTNEGLRLQFKIKLDITAKIILTGFCIGLVTLILIHHFSVKLIRVNYQTFSFTNLTTRH